MNTLIFPQKHGAAWVETKLCAIDQLNQCSHFNRILVCDRQTDILTQTERHNDS